MQRIISLELEVKQSLHVGPVGTAPRVIVDCSRKVGAAEQWRDMVKYCPQYNVDRVSASPDVIIVQFFHKPQKFCAVELVLCVACGYCGNNPDIDIRPSRAGTVISCA